MQFTGRTEHVTDLCKTQCLLEDEQKKNQLVFVCVCVCGFLLEGNHSTPHYDIMKNTAPIRGKNV
jgi:hypothetical protein